VGWRPGGGAGGAGGECGAGIFLIVLADALFAVVLAHLPF
jgi:hypothetical protein